MVSRYKVLGINDDKTYCQCCGRNGLKSVVWIEDTETDEVKHFGSTCALSPKHGFDVDKEIKEAIKSEKDRLQAVWSLMLKEYKAQGGKMIQDQEMDRYGIMQYVGSSRVANMTAYLACESIVLAKFPHLVNYFKKD